MKKKIKYFILFVIMSMFSSNVSANYDKLAYDFSFKDLDGSELKLSNFKERNPDSNAKVVKIKWFFAPIAFITPMSLVLSKTEAYIVFAIFTPATIKEIKAIKINTTFIVDKIEVNDFITCSKVSTKKSSLPLDCPLSFLNSSCILLASSAGSSPGEERTMIDW